jgi:internalin A
MQGTAGRDLAMSFTNRRRLPWGSSGGGTRRRLTRSAPRILVLLPFVLGAGLSGTAVGDEHGLVADKNLGSAISHALVKPSATLSSRDLQSLTCLSANDRQITNLSGLEWATNLTALYLNDNAIRDLDPLRSLSKLESLQLENNQISDLSPLAALTNLRCLSLGGSYVGSYATLALLTNLTDLSVRRGYFRDLSCLGNLGQLRFLLLWQNGIHDVSPLSGLTNLTRLDLRWNFIKDFAPLLVGPTNLTSLYLGGNHLSNAPSLKGLRKLTLLNLDENSISDITPVTGLTNLTYLSLNGNPITNHWMLTNLLALASLELRGNAIKSLGFMSDIKNLSYADLAYNNITKIPLASGLSNLSSVVFAGNPLANHSAVTNMRSVTNLWLFDNRLSNADFVRSLPWLKHLNLEGNSLTNIPKFLSLTNLAGLGLSRNPITDYAALAALTSLKSLRLEGNRLSDVAFLTNSKALSFLSLNQNRITNINALAGLKGLQHLYLHRNNLSDVQPLTNEFEGLLNVDFSLNSIDVAEGSPAMTVVHALQSRTSGARQCDCTLGKTLPDNLQCQRVQVRYLPTNQPPRIGFSSNVATRGRWYVSCSATSFLNLTLSEDPPPGDENVIVTATSADPNLVQIVNNPLTGTNYNRALTITANCAAPTNPTTVTLIARDDVGLCSSSSVEVVVLPHIRFSDVLQSSRCPTVDSNFLAAISAAAGKSVEDLFLADVLNLNDLSVHDADIDNPCAWRWLTNLTNLRLSGDGVNNLDSVGDLPALTSLTLSGTSVRDLSPILALTNITTLALESPSITNYDAVLPSLINLSNLTLASTELSNACFLQSLGQLTSLNLDHARLRNIECLTSLTNLVRFEAEYNLLTNICSLTNLSRLSYVDVRYNLLDTMDRSNTLGVIETWGSNGVVVLYSPQRTPPIIQISSNWVVAAGQPSVLSFAVLDDGQRAGTQVNVTNAYPLSPSGILDDNLIITQVTNDWSIDWFLLVTPITNGTTVITLTATNDVGLGWSTQVVITVGTPLSVADVLGTSGLTWRSGSDAPWFGQSAEFFGTNRAVQTGSISNGGISSLEASVTGPGTLTFWWRISSELNGDWLESDLLGQTNRITGETSWQCVSVMVPPGLHTNRWRYVKDSCCVSGADAGWLAQVAFVPGSWLEFSNGVSSLRCCCVLGEHYELETSRDLVSWESAERELFLCTNSVMTISNPVLVGDTRFYRLKTTPPPLLTMSWLTPTQLAVSWTGSVFGLQTAATLAGPWGDVGSNSPVSISTQSAASQFFRLQAASR